VQNQTETETCYSEPCQFRTKATPMVAWGFQGHLPPNCNIGATLLQGNNLHKSISREKHALGIKRHGATHRCTCKLWLTTCRLWLLSRQHSHQASRSMGQHAACNTTKSSNRAQNWPSACCCAAANRAAAACCRRCCCCCWRCLSCARSCC
jgi:hypothetical protein